MCDYNYSTLQLILIIDFDECVGEGSGNKCEQGCVNNPGGYDCTCYDGFELVHDTECQGRTNIIIIQVWDSIWTIYNRF